MTAAAPGLRFGIVQGRLVQSPPGELQWFPQRYWESEFFIAGALGIDYIELIAERNHNPGNPLWLDGGIARMRDLAAANRMSLHALCDDFIIDHALCGDDAVLRQVVDLVGRGGRLGARKLVLPLFEASELTPTNAAAFRDPLRAIADAAAAQGMLVCLETILTARELMAALDAFGHSALSVVYDTGNRVAFGHDLPGDIRLLGSRISHVHIKDKNSANRNVLLGTGLVDFRAVFEVLAEIGYSGPYTFETQRGRNPARTARYNMGVVEFFHAEAEEARS